MSRRRGQRRGKCVSLQSYRAELAHFVAAVRGEAKYEAPADQAVVLRVLGSGVSGRRR